MTTDLLLAHFHTLRRRRNAAGRRDVLRIDRSRPASRPTATARRSRRPGIGDEVVAVTTGLAGVVA